MRILARMNLFILFGEQLLKHLISSCLEGALWSEGGFFESKASFWVFSTCPLGLLLGFAMRIPSVLLDSMGLGLVVSTFGEVNFLFPF